MLFEDRHWNLQIHMKWKTNYSIIAPGALSPPEPIGTTSLALGPQTAQTTTPATRIKTDATSSSDIALHLHYHLDLQGFQLVGGELMRYAISGVREASRKLRRGSTATLVCTLTMTFSDENNVEVMTFGICIRTGKEIRSLLMDGSCPYLT